MFVFPCCSPEKVLNITFILPTLRSKRRGAWRQETGGMAERRGLLLAPDKPRSYSWEPAGKQSLSHGLSSLTCGVQDGLRVAGLRLDVTTQPAQVKQVISSITTGQLVLLALPPSPVPWALMGGGG